MLKRQFIIDIANGSYGIWTKAAKTIVEINQSEEWDKLIAEMYDQSFIHAPTSMQNSIGREVMTRLFLIYHNIQQVTPFYVREYFNKAKEVVDDNGMVVKWTKDIELFAIERGIYCSSKGLCAIVFSAKTQQFAKITKEVKNGLLK